ncbi:MAG: RNA polymerase sigma factor [Candidatus Izimaplasma sp.]|nr:RNA polymerase sigma factor [Candidatus Izimaplasma bacterium]
MADKDINELVKKLQNGNIEVFDDIYYQTKNIVYYSIFIILKDYQLSEDIMQDTYLKALDKIHSYKRKAHFKSWLVTIAKNLAINEFNRRKREMLIDISENEYILGSTASTAENEILISQIFKILNNIEKEVIILHVVGDMKHREIAKLLDKPLGTITWIYNKAIKKLRSEV